MRCLKRRMLSGVLGGGPGSGSASACSGGGELPSSSLGPLSGEVASPCSSPSEPCVLSGGFVLVFAAVVLRTCRLDQALMSWSGATTGGVGPCPVSESESLLVLLLLELDSSGQQQAARCARV